MSSSDRDQRPAWETDPQAAMQRERERASEVGRLRRALARILEDNHLSPKIAALYRDYP